MILKRQKQKLSVSALFERQLLKSENQQPSWNVEGLVTKIGSVLRNVVKLFKIFLEFLESMDWVLRLSVPELGVTPFEPGQRDGQSGTKIRSEPFYFGRWLDITYVTDEHNYYCRES